MNNSGQNQLRLYVNNNKKMNLLLKSDKDKKIRNTARIKFVMNIPYNNKEVMMFDVKNGNTNSKDSDRRELKQIYNFNLFDYIGSVKSAPIPPRHNEIQVHPICDYKQDETYMA